MPLYDFCCEKCGTEFEVQRALGATGAVKCPHCGSTKTTKVFSATGIVFKGSGFYVTDSKSKAGGSSESKSTTGKPVEKTAETATESKPAPAETSKPAVSKDPE